MAKTLEQINREFVDEWVLNRPITDRIPTAEEHTETSSAVFHAQSDPDEIFSFSDYGKPTPAPQANLTHKSDLDTFIAEIDEMISPRTAQPEPPFEYESTDIPLCAESVTYTADSDYSEVQQTKPAKKRVAGSIISNILFYVFIIGAVAAAFASTLNNDGKPHDFFGYSYFKVDSGSMQKVYPIGTLIVTHKTDPKDLKTGDDITFFMTSTKIVTHRIMDVYENLNGNERGFQTQGVNNAKPDTDIVLTDQVIGKVIFSAQYVGAFLDILREKLVTVMLVLALLLILSFSLQVLFRIRKEEKEQKLREGERKTNLMSA